MVYIISHARLRRIHYPLFDPPLVYLSQFWGKLWNMKKSQIRAILFDKDGTLLDFEASWFPIALRILRELKEGLGLPECLVAALAEAGGIGPRGFERECLFQSAATSEIVAAWEGILHGQGYVVQEGRLAAIFEAASTSREAQPRLVAGVPALLDRLHSLGYLLGIATSDSRASTIHGLKSVGILDAFDYIAADGDGLPAKPNPKAARDFRRRYGLGQSSLAIIGDSYGDMVFARRAKARFIGMRTACNRPEAFLSAGYPVVGDFSDLQAMEALLA